MRISKREVNIGAEVILFNEHKVIILKEGEIQFEIQGEIKVVPIYPKGRFMPIRIEYEGDYFNSYAIGIGVNMKAIGYVLDNVNDEYILKAIASGEIEVVSENEVSNIILFFF